MVDVADPASADEDEADLGVLGVGLLRRVSWGSILKLAIIGLLIYGLATAFSNVSLSQIEAELRGADWTWWLGALALSPFVQVGLALVTIGACLRPVRFSASLMLQYAIQFIALAIPSTAARLAMEIRFFQKIGVPAAGALTISAVDGFSGFIVQVTLLLIIIVGGLASVAVDSDSATSTSTSTSGDGSVVDWAAVALAMGVLVLSLIASLVVPRVRAVARRVFTLLRDKVNEGREPLRVVRHPRNLLLMFGGNLIAQLLMAFMLGLCLRAFGQSTSFANLVLINTFVSLFAGFMPVPGGVGVAEAALTYGLTAVGVPEAVAVSTAVSFRLVTFYLPPAWTWYSMRWLRKRDLL